MPNRGRQGGVSRMRWTDEREGAGDLVGGGHPVEHVAAARGALRALNNLG